MTTLKKIQAPKTGITINVVHKNQDGSRVDITGYYFRLLIKRSPTSSGACVDKTITSHTNAAQGETQIPVTAADLADANGAYYFWIMVKSSANGLSRPSQRGVIEVL